MTASEESVADFYAPVMAPWPPEVQRLVVRLLGGELKQAIELEDAIMAAAQATADEESNA